MNDRILGALQVAGIKDTPLASLDHEQQFFALTPQVLLYQAADPASPLQQVTLREISRIHSDHQGTLRVETGNQTSITASLLGFDPHRVQRFFQTVRDTTARAKQQPSSPLPSVGSKMFGTPATSSTAATRPATPSSTAPETSSAAQTTSAPSERGTIVLGKVSSGAEAAPTTGGEAASAPTVVKIGGSPSPAPSTQSAPPKVSPATTRIEAAAPVKVTAGSATTFNKPEPLASPSKPGPTAGATAPGSSSPVISADAAVQATPAADLVPAVPSSSLSAPSSGPSAQRLARSAQTVGSLRVTVRVLALVLVLGALGMGYVLWQQGKSSQIPALWTVTMGVVTSVALLVLAEVLKLLSALGQVVSAAAPRTGE